VGARAVLDGRKISSPPGFDPGSYSTQSVVIPTELPGPRTIIIYIYIAIQFKVKISPLNCIYLSLSLYIYIYMYMCVYIYMATFSDI